MIVTQKLTNLSLKSVRLQREVLDITLRVWRYNNQYNGTWQNDTWRYVAQHNNTQYNDKKSISMARLTAHAERYFSQCRI